MVAVFFSVLHLDFDVVVVVAVLMKTHNVSRCVVVCFHCWSFALL